MRLRLTPTHRRAVRRRVRLAPFTVVVVVPPSGERYYVGIDGSP